VTNPTGAVELSATIRPGARTVADNSVWDDLIGQEPLVGLLRDAVDAAGDRVAGGAGVGMTHAWLFTGPPGSGRSNAARAFAAALQCERGGCGSCNACRTALSGAHPDVALVATEGLSIGVDQVRDLVRDAALAPASGRWQVIVVEDADRLTEEAADALLKSLEEPAARTVWILCAPTPEDVLATIRSRCRHVVLRTPPTEAVARLLMDSAGVPEELAWSAARAAQGHVGRARRLATDEDTRTRRREIIGLPASLTDLGACLEAAANLHATAEAEGAAVAERLDERERVGLETVYGVAEGSSGRRVRGYTGALSTLKKDQERRKKRVVRDSIDGALLDLLSFYRDVLVVQLEAGADLVNADVRAVVVELAGRGTPEQTLGRIEAILACREALEANAAPLLALESLMLQLRV
jgi:DNA polymerase III subunit delta'